MKKLILCMCFCFLFGSLSCGAYAREQTHYESEDNDTMSEADYASLILTEGDNALDIEGVVTGDDLVDWCKVEVKDFLDVKCTKAIAHLLGVQPDCELEICFYNPLTDRYMYANDRGMIEDIVLTPGKEYYIKVKYIKGPVSQPYYLNFEVDYILR